ncbi:MAG: hypothetical protein KBC57_07625 [Neisseriaceae bacterium]|nr:hypothetical protein [Neisseriaceae bacterium]
MFINKFLLSEPELYTELRQQLLGTLHGEEINILNVKHIAYTGWHKRNYQVPDNVFLNHWQNLEKRVEESNQHLSLALLSQVSRYYFEEIPDRVNVKFHRFGEWQHWIANQSGLPVIAKQIHRYLFAHHKNPFNKLDHLKSLLGFRTLVSPYHALVEDYIQREGLHETHMHLNGTTSVEILWHHALRAPEQTINEMIKSNNSNRVHLFYAATPTLNSPTKYKNLLILARYLREYFLTVLHVEDDNETKQHTIEEAICSLLKNNIIYADFSNSFSYEKLYFGDNKYQAHLHEVRLHIDIIETLENGGYNPILDTAYLLYILCLNCFQRLLVQRDDQFGFNQFQKLADIGTREHFEQRYDARFHQLHGPNIYGRPDLSTLEGRFAPKKDSLKNYNLIHSMLKGFLIYANGATPSLDCKDLNELALEVMRINRPAFRLIPHFIKKPWQLKHKNIPEDFHFKCLREELAQSGNVLLDLLSYNPNLKNIITGIDAAANELETPPEVFAPLFAHFRRNGMTHFTYHVGEDFEYILNGIRAIHETITFLKFNAGDRIGHATAIGINPYLWKKRVADTVFLPQGQWLENLLFLRSIMLDGVDIHMSDARLEHEIDKTAQRIFGKKIIGSEAQLHSTNNQTTAHINLTVLQQFYHFRFLCPLVVKDFMHGNYNKEAYFYLDDLNKLKDNYPEVLSLLMLRWFDPDVIKQYDFEKKEYSITDIPLETITSSQQYVLSLVAKKQIILETLPTSNVRISHYHSIKEHHVFRWLQIPQCTIQGDEKVLVSLGSDDTGIFATDMRNEFYHLFSTLINEFEYSAHDSLNLVARLNETGRIYRFDSKNNRIGARKHGYAEK